MAGTDSRREPVWRERLERLRPTRSFALVVLVLLAVYLPTATYDYRVSTDPALAALPAWNLVENGTLDLRPYEDMLSVRPGGVEHLVDIGDATYSNRTGGVVLWGAAFYAIASPFVDDTMPFPMFPAAIAGAVATAMAMGILHLVIRRLHDSVVVSIGAALVAGLATNVWSISADALWPHGPTQLFLAGALLGMSGGRHLAAGLAFGLALLVRPYAAVSSAIAGTWISLSRRSLRPAVAVAAGTAVGLAALMAYNAAVYESLSVTGGYGHRDYVTDATSVTGRNPALVLWSLTGAFIDPQRGMLWYSPFLLVLVPGLRAGWRSAHAWVRAAAFSGAGFLLAQYWVQANNQGGDTFFAYRYSLEALMLAAPLLFLSWRHWVVGHPMRERFFRGGVVLALALQILGAAVEPHKWLGG